MIKYKTWDTQFRARPEIQEVHVEKETKTSIWINGKRRNKSNSWETFHDSWEAAHRFLTNEAVKNVNKAEEKMKNHIADLLKIRAMEPPAKDQA